MLYNLAIRVCQKRQSWFFDRKNLHLSTKRESVSRSANRTADEPVGQYFISLLYAGVAHSAQLPRSIGKFIEFAHDVSSGFVDILNDKQIRIANLAYDGEGPDVFFWIGKTKNGRPDSHGKIVPYLNSTTSSIPGFDGKTTVTLTLPDGITVKDINYLSIWCRAYKVDFGHVKIPDLSSETSSVASDADNAPSTMKKNAADKTARPQHRRVQLQPVDDDDLSDF